MRKAILLLAWLSVTSNASATLIEYTATNLGGNTWQYEYTLTNDTLGFAIEEFTIFFDVGLFANIGTSGFGAPTLWDPLVVQPEPGLPVPSDGFYDALALGEGIAPGATLGGFFVSFDYFGSGTPGDQFWNVVDPQTFATLDEGTTFTTGVPPTPVMEPPVIGLMLGGWLLVAATRRRIG